VQLIVSQMVRRTRLFARQWNPDRNAMKRSQISAHGPAFTLVTISGTCAGTMEREPPMSRGGFLKSSKSCRMWRSHSGVYECCYILGYISVQSLCEATIRRNILPLSSGSKFIRVRDHRAAGGCLNLYPTRWQQSSVKATLLNLPRQFAN
jgi:hypothetical protein